MLGMGSGNVNEESADQSSSAQAPAGAPAKPRKPEGFAGVIFTVEHFIKNFSRINWSATFKALLASLSAKGGKKSKKKMSPAPQASSMADLPVTPSITVTPVSEDAEIEAWLNSITDKASRSTAKSAKPSSNKASVKKSPAKKAAVTKKAAPKTTNKRK